MCECVCVCVAKVCPLMILATETVCEESVVSSLCDESSIIFVIVSMIGVSRAHAVQWKGGKAL